MLVGHVEQGRALRAAFVSAQMHHAWLLAGPPGIGKARFADAAATWILARASGHAIGVDDDSFDVDPGHPNAKLIAAGSHLDLRRLERTTDPAGKLRANIRVDDVRALQPLIRSTPALSAWRVVIIDAIDDMNRPAANAFLKNLEEPPPNTLFLGVSHSPGRLLPTIRSRCRVLRFSPLDDAEVDAVLAEQAPDASDAERAAMRAIAEGRPGRALRFAAAGVDGLLRELDALAVAPSAAAAGRALALAKSLAAKSAAPRYEAFLDLAPAYLAAAARTRTGTRLAHALSLWEKANALGSAALGLSLEPQSVAFELGTLVGGLADVGQEHRGSP